MKSLALFFVMLVCAVALASAQDYIGRVDTIGGTTYDWQVGWSAKRTLLNSPRFGVHAVWLFSADNGGTFPDRNARYNFYDFTTREWSWLDPDYMQSGVNIASNRIGFGNIDADGATGAMSACGYEGAVNPFVMRDAAGGGGIFDGCAGPTGYTWPLMAIGDDGTYHVMLTEQSGFSGIWYSRVRTWCNWDTPVQLAQADMDAYNVAASKVSPAVCLVWADEYGSAFYRESENRGDTWGEVTGFDPPPAFGGDTVTKFSLYGLFPFFDAQGRLHVVAAVYPVVHDTAYENPAEIWHWCRANQPHWAEIHRAGCAPEHQEAGVGYNAIFADRPSMGQAADGRLYVTWEQFDSSNVEPQTNLLRAGIWASSSPDNGGSWTPGVLLTERNASSHRFPCVIDRMVAGGPSEDTICVLYLMDQVAGFFVYGQGPCTPNPIVCQFIPSPLVGVEETPNAEVQTPNVRATVVCGMLFLEAYGTRHTAYGAELLDISGRKALDLHTGANDVSRLSPGVYFVRERSAVGGERSAIRKVVVTR